MSNLPPDTIAAASPILWQPRPILHTWTADQARVAACFPSMRRVVVPAANGVGKTFLAADLVVSFILDMPAAAVIITAPTNRQVSELLWPHVTERLLHVGMADQDWIIPTKPRWKGGDSDSLIGFATNTPQRMQGFHAPNLLIVLDEASGMPQSLVEALEGIANAEGNYILAIGNPNTPDGAFYNMTHLPSWHTEEISALSHPNILQRREVIPGATSWASLVDRVRDWCKEVAQPGPETFTLSISNAGLHSGPDQEQRPRHFLPNDAFRVRYLGRFPRAAAWNLIPRAHINAAQDATLWGDAPKLAALDVARTGGDRTIYGIRQGDTVTKMRIITATDLMSQAEEIAALLREDLPESVLVDAAGLGVGLADRLAQIVKHTIVRAFYGSEEPTSPLQQKKFFNRRAQAYGNLAEAMEQHRISIPKDADLADELAAVLYKHTPDGRLQILDKEEVKKHLGRSPDAADMISLLWEAGTVYSAAPAALPRREEEIQW